MDGLVSSALMIRLSLQPSPASDASAFNNIRALRSRWAGLFPFRISASSRSRSSPLSRTIYFFTEISFAAMIASVARVATKANHQILSIWWKRPTRAKLGNPSNLNLAGSAGRTAQIEAADQFALGLAPVIQAIRSTGTLLSLGAMAIELNRRGIRSARG